MARVDYRRRQLFDDLKRMAVGENVPYIRNVFIFLYRLVGMQNGAELL